MIWNEETVGITDADRAYHLKWHYFGSLCLSLMCGLLGYSIYLTKTEDDHLQAKAFKEIEAFYIAFTIIFALRLFIRLFLICKWHNKKIDPSYADARAGFW